MSSLEACAVTAITASHGSGRRYRVASRAGETTARRITGSVARRVAAAASLARFRWTAARSSALLLSTTIPLNAGGRVASEAVAVSSGATA
jgi:hypothetical protein